MRARRRRILPARWPRTMCSLSSRTRKVALGSCSTTSPSSSIPSSSAMAGATLMARRGAPAGRSARGAAGPTAGAGAGAPARVPAASGPGTGRGLGRGLVEGGGVVVARGPRAGARASGRRAAGGRGRVVVRRGGPAARAVGARGARRAAGAGVVPVERLGLEGLRGLGEVVTAAAVGGRHVVVPDPRGERAALDLD